MQSDARRPAALPASPPRRQAERFSGFQARWNQHPGFGLTVDRLLRAYRDAERGWPRDQCDIFEDRIEADAHLRSLIEWRVDAVAKRQWTIQEGGDDLADKQAAELLERALRETPNWSAALEHQARGTMMGWSASEVVWERLSIGNTVATVPVWFENVPHRRFVFGDDDELRLGRDIADLQGEPLRPWGWWVSSRSGRIVAATGLMRTAALWSLFKSMSVRDWIVYMDRFGIPFVTGRYDDETSPEDMAKLKLGAQSLGSDGWAVFHDSMQLEIHQAIQGSAGQSESVHAALTNLCDSQISKLIAGATLLTETQGPGSFALGKVHQSRGFSLLQADESWLASSFEQQIGVPFVRFNGLNARAPRLKIHLDLDQSVAEWVAMASMAANELGLEIDEDQFRQRTLLRSPTGNSLTGTKSGGGDGQDQGQDENKKEEVA